MSFHQNKILLENQRQGNPNWKLTLPAVNREVEGYASKTSINIGESIDFYVSTKSNEFSLTIFRMGWYNGIGARQIGNTNVLKGVFQDNVITDLETGLIKCDWIKSFSLKTTSEWTTGIHVAKLEEFTTKKQSYIIFVIRDDSSSSEILFQLPVTTYQAYNFWGGKSLYDWASGSKTSWGNIYGNRAYKVSFDRPYVSSNNTKASFGMGAGEFFTNVQPVTLGYPISSAAWDYNMVRWLEKKGYDVNYITNLDTHSRPELLNKTKVFMSHGHDEYWSYEMRKNVEIARDSGVNLTFFSSNTMFWQIRFEKNSPNNCEPRTIVCYKDSEIDPIKGEKSTTSFRNIKQLKGESELIGVQYITDPVMGDIKIKNANHWVFKGTGIKNGSKLKGLLGYEVDGISKDSPKNITLLAVSKSKRIDEGNVTYILKYMGVKISNILKSIFAKLFKVNVSGIKLILSVLAIGLCFFYFTLFFLGAKIMLWLLGTFSLLLLVWYFKLFFSKNFVSNMTIYRAKNGSFVFATGSMQWSWGLDDFNSDTLRKSYRSKHAEIITNNILEKFISN